MPPPLILPSFGESKLRLLDVLPRRLRVAFLALLALTDGDGILEPRCPPGVSPVPSNVTRSGVLGESDGGSSAATRAYEGSAVWEVSVAPEVSVVAEPGAVENGLAAPSRA